MINVDERTATLKLEGKIIGRWVAELEKECKKCLQRKIGLILDLSSVAFIGDQGIKMLQEMDKERVKLIGCSLFLKELLAKAGLMASKEP